MQKPQKVLIVGGGFGGIRAALDLSKRLKRKEAEITLVSDKNYFEYYPALYRIVTGASPIEVCVPLSDILPKSVRLMTDSISSVSLSEKIATGASGSSYHFDFIILALGSETTYFNVEGADTLSLGFKSISEALRLRRHITKLFEEHAHPNQNELVSHFHVLIVGGGPSGVEVAGDLTAHMRHLARAYHVEPSLVTIDLVEGNSRILPALPEAVSARVLARLRVCGVNIFLNRQMMKEDVEQVYMKDMSMQTKTVIWTAGTRINNLFTKISGLSFSKNNRVLVDEYLQAVGHEGAYAVGDAAFTKYTGLAQTAIYDGKFAAKDIAARVRGRTRAAYRPKPVAFSIPVGDNWGVFVMGKFRIYGRIAYWMRHLIDFMFFAGILSPRKLISIFFEGFKYRKIKE